MQVADLAEPQQAPTRERGATLAEELQHTLESQIVGGLLKPGARLDEAELCERFQMSRTPVREALKALAGIGLVDMRGQKGASVARLSVSTLIEMFQVMSQLEGLCARYAARRSTDEQRTQLARVHERLEQIADGDHSRFYDVNQEFHDALYDASNTSYLASQTRMLRKRLRVYRQYVTHHPGRMTATIVEHAGILQAIARRDAEAAFNAASSHVTLLQDDMVDLIAAFSQNFLPNANP
jgi:DNA-binding GntR family transcriptional regulator